MVKVDWLSISSQLSSVTYPTTLAINNSLRGRSHTPGKLVNGAGHADGEERGKDNLGEMHADGVLRLS